jgi:hypothetical protein
MPQNHKNHPKTPQKSPKNLIKSQKNPPTHALIYHFRPSFRPFCGVFRPIRPARRPWRHGGCDLGQNRWKFEVLGGILHRKSVNLSRFEVFLSDFT